MYDIRDVIKKACQLCDIRLAYLNKARENAGDIRMRMVIGIFVRSIEKEKQYYQKLLATSSEQIEEPIGFDIYDKISFLVNQFSHRLKSSEILDRKAFVKYEIEQEKALYALLVDIQGRIVIDKYSTSTKAYLIMQEIINEKNKKILDLVSYEQKK